MKNIYLLNFIAHPLKKAWHNWFQMIMREYLLTITYPTFISLSTQGRCYLHIHPKNWPPAHTPSLIMCLLMLSIYVVIFSRITSHKSKHSVTFLAYLTKWYSSSFRTIMSNSIFFIVMHRSAPLQNIFSTRCFYFYVYSIWFPCFFHQI